MQSSLGKYEDFEKAESWALLTLGGLHMIGIYWAMC